MWLWLIGCAATTTPPADSGNPSESGAGPQVHTYTDGQGVACVTGDADGTTVGVDFGDCLFCTSSVDLWCEVELVGGELQVHAGGTLVTGTDCPTAPSTCAPITTRCTAEALTGSVTLAYGGQSVAAALPSGTWTCTGPSAAF